MAAFPIRPSMICISMLKNTEYLAISPSITLIVSLIYYHPFIVEKHLCTSGHTWNEVYCALLESIKPPRFRFIKAKVVLLYLCRETAITDQVYISLFLQSHLVRAFILSVGALKSHTSQTSTTAEPSLSSTSFLFSNNLWEPLFWTWTSPRPFNGWSG